MKRPCCENSSVSALNSLHLNQASPEESPAPNRYKFCERILSKLGEGELTSEEGYFRVDLGILKETSEGNH